MKRISLVLAFLLLLSMSGFAQPSSDAKPASKVGSFQVPVEYYKLPNGLRVVLSARPHRAHRRHRRLLPHRFSHRARRPHRLRAPVRAHDVSGLAEPGQDGIHQARPAERRRAQRLHAFRFHQLLRDSSRQQARDRAVGRGRPHEGPRHHRRQSQEPARRRRQRGQGQRAQPALWRFPLARHAAIRQHQLV